ncbi:hypothetical protein [Pseudoroseomonas ludipueritiae]|uniref:Uncharacterized protein n=1 Tax=Pseudoroseomonas ludipueritiae TaxID=198093 RepID=A0ABR7R7U9_9PROT|nr:hypothetical protein [Pseudoroseomonas ludipueritiae]MBC9177832.1 hypothetical protein [Pseudoroseomonas ludipueritiae]MCG7363174.1 hypothetical protein [Roseomonas sp. ACRSG]
MKEDEAAEFWLSTNGAEFTAGFGAGERSRAYLQSVQSELAKVICGDEKYTELRQSLVGYVKAGKYTAVAAIAAAIAPYVGFAASALVPAIALLLDWSAKIGVEAWCNMPPESAA